MDHPRELEILHTETEVDGWLGGRPLHISEEDRKKGEDAIVDALGGYVRFHPFPVSLLGWLGVRSGYQGNEIAFPLLPVDQIASVTRDKGRTTVVWHVPVLGKAPSFVHRQITFDSRVGNMPIRGSLSDLSNGKRGMLYQRFTSEWKQENDGIWIPAKMSLEDITGGEKNPTETTEIALSLEWETDLESLDAEFARVPDDLDRLAWSERIEKWLGEPDRSDLEHALASGVQLRDPIRVQKKP